MPHTPPPNEYQHEIALIEKCAQTALPEPARREVEALLAGALDWNYIVRIASRNAVLPLVSLNLLKRFPDSLGDELKASLNRNLMHQTKTNMLLTQRLVELVALFDRHRIPVLPFKGPLLAQQAYKNLALRQFVDLDVLVPPKHLMRAAALLAENGYEQATRVTWLNRTSFYLSRVKDIGFRKKDGTVNLELHWKLSGTHFSLPFELNRLWENLETVDFAGRRIKALPFAELLIYLCLHGSRHSWERLNWICDVNELVRAQGDAIDWEKVYGDARSLGCENILGLGLYLAHDFFGLETPLANWPEIKRDATFGEIAAQVRRRLFEPEMSSLDIGERYAYHLKLKEKSTDRWKLHLHYLFWYLRIIFTPNAQDRSVFAFPQWLAPLYYVTRPLRLFYTYVLKTEKD